MMKMHNGEESRLATWGGGLVMSKKVSDCNMWGLLFFSLLHQPADTAKKVACPPERVDRKACPVVLACNPSNACLGGNVCATGYQYLQLECQRKQSGNVTCSDDSDCDGSKEDGKCTVYTPQFCSKCTKNVCTCVVSDE
jgi:hypothetical protein